MPRTIQDVAGQWWIEPTGTAKWNRYKVYDSYCPDCGVLTSLKPKRLMERRCHACKQFGDRNPNWKGANIIHYRICKDCGDIKIRRTPSRENFCMSCRYKGERNHKWKDGRSKVRHEKIYMPTHPNADKKGSVLVHRLVMEEKLGRYLTSEEIVHHINQDKHDNRPENLWLFSSNSEHTRWHNWLDKRERIN